MGIFKREAKDQLNMKSKAVSVANKQRLDNAILQQDTYTPQNQSFMTTLRKQLGVL